MHVEPTLSLGNRSGFGRGLGFSVALHATVVLLLIIFVLHRRPDLVPPFLTITVELVPFSGTGDEALRQASATNAKPEPTQVPGPATSSAVPQPVVAPVSSEAPTATKSRVGSDQVESLLASVERAHKAAAVEPAARPSGIAAGAATVGRAVSGKLGGEGLADIIRAQVERRWEFDVKSLGMVPMEIAVHLRLDPGGRVQAADIVDDPRYLGDPTYRALAGSVRNAVLLSSPLQLPPELYEAYKDLTVRFSPRDVLR